MRVDLSPRLGGGDTRVSPQPWREIDGQLSGQSIPHYCPPPIHLHSTPLRNGTVRSHSMCGTESWTELELAFHVTLLWPSWLDYRVPTTPCISRLKTKRLKTLSTYQENFAWIKSSRYYSRNIGGGTFVIMSPGPNIGGDVSPLSHRDRRPWSGKNGAS